MTREDKLYAMRMVDLVNLAEKLNIKINKKGSKTVAIEKIMAAEAAKQPESEIKPEPKAEENLVPMPGAEKLSDLKTEYAKPKRGQLIEYNGKTQNICAWAKELGISANTLYGRLYKMHWSIEKAFTTKKGE